MENIENLKKLFEYVSNKYLDTSIEWKCLGLKKETQVKIFYDKEIKKINIIFESSGRNRNCKIKIFGKNISFDWILNFLFLPIWVKPYKNMKVVYRTHLGFTLAWKAIEDEIALIIKNIIQENNLNNENFLGFNVFGWSHGGALAQFMHEWLNFNYSDKELNSCTIGSPRLFHIILNKKKKEEMAKRFETMTLIGENNDIVTHLPPVCFLFLHIKKVLRIGDKFNLFKLFKPKTYHHIDTYIKDVKLLGEK